MNAMQRNQGNGYATWDPFRDLDEFSRRLGGFFGRVPMKAESDLDRFTAARWAPPVDIVESDREYLIRAELAGIEPAEVKVRVEEGNLVIEGERSFASEQSEAKAHRIERAYGSFRRTFRLPDDAGADGVHAEFKLGVLEVHLPKSEAARPRQIEVKVS